MTDTIWKWLIVFLTVFTVLKAVQDYHTDYEYQMSNLEERVEAVESQVYELMK